MQFKSSGLVCDESALTGESRDIPKSDENPFILSGSSIKLGAGVMLVTCVGLFSEEGIIQKIITGIGKAEVCRSDSHANNNSILPPLFGTLVCVFVISD